jgi:hypothetical protein
VIAALGVVALLAQAAPVATPVITGPNGPVLNADDIAQITALVTPKGCAPWVLFVSDIGFIPALSVTVDCAAPVNGIGVRRGRRHEVSAEVRGRALDQPRAWVYVSDGAWVQVPVRDTAPDSTNGATGQGRPFRADPSLSDDDVASIVAFIRTNPRAESPSGQSAPQVPGDRPIQSIRTARGSSETARWDVTLPSAADRERAAVAATIERRAGAWVVVKVGMVVWD